MEEIIRELRGGNIDVDLTSSSADITWSQDRCPWNALEDTDEPRCAVKNTSICRYFSGIKPLDTVLCSYPSEKG